MASSVDISEMRKLNIFDDLHGAFNIYHLVESTKKWKGAIHEKTKRLIDNLFDWIPKLIRRMRRYITQRTNGS